ncbi:maleylpyruvate isomerase family mycothiol-dependent enzyme [Nocardia sp. CDC160]|uniref:maleylpyruvate isomerase family mycothiol-dependent enzyme n=1 Tax=Nocardia sp. CDC160 TaxID=3112166 RepID=UPI002DBEC654|nr:maleylpyruvate isomerase family mycothiol-dependent enzyme [Nocardia sp. CDC160]MEC3918297.1 maleylpyruvate isomerase family mycothiol-dependent enzyme [Nocardia sp. CDC160]
MTGKGVEWLEPIEASTRRFLATVETLTDAEIAGESLIPPWTRGHVIAHVCRAGDSLVRLLTWARTGIETPQYASMEVRAEEIEAGAGRPVAEQLDDLVASAQRFADAVRSLTPTAWNRAVRARTGELRTPEAIVPMRLRELEIHHADLNAGYSFSDIPEPAARWILEDMADAFARREHASPALLLRATDTDFCRDLTGDRRAATVEIAGAQADLLGWLSGRIPAERAGLTADRTGRIPPAPTWI